MAARPSTRVWDTEQTGNLQGCPAENRYRASLYSRVCFSFLCSDVSGVGVLGMYAGHCVLIHPFLKSWD